MKYGERVAQSTTPQSAKSTSGAAGSASRQAGAMRGSEEGMTSIVVVFVLVTLLTLIGIGFTKVMNRSLQSSAASQQASAANYAAQSGVNDVLSYLKTNPATAATKCDDLIKTGGPLEKAANLSSDGNTAYTCVLVDPTPTSLFYQGLAPYKSQIVKITTSATLSSLLFSWQSPTRTHNQLVAAGAQTLYDEKTWSTKNYAPLLRVTLYPIPASGDLSGVQNAAKTLFLYPQASGSNTLAYAAAGDTTAVNCSSKNLGGFVGSADYDCNLVINNLPSASYFYARFTPYYDQAVVKIKGNDGSGQPVQFKNVQSVVDVTAKSGGATKRLQARVDTSAAGGGTDFNISAGSDNAPEFALGSANTICKRLIVPPSVLNPVITDPGSAANCPFSLYGAPTVSISASPLTIASGGSSTLTWTSTNADTCTASGDWSGAKPINSSASTGPLSGPKTYTYTLTCTGPGGSGNNSTSVTVNAPPPSFSFNPDRNSIGYNESTTLRWSTSNVTWCWASGAWSSWKNPSGGSEGTGNLTSSQTYSLQCGGPGGSAPTQTRTITVNPPPPPPTCTDPAATNFGGPLPCTYPPPPPKVNVRINSAVGSWDGPGGRSSFCGDSVHYWVICVNWTWWSPTDQGSLQCHVLWNGANKSGDFYERVGYGSILSTKYDTFALGFTNVGTPAGNVKVDCWTDKQPSPGSDSTYVSCSNFTNVSWACFASSSPPLPGPAPIPPSPPPGGGGGGGGVCPPGWSGTWPSCSPPGGGGGCGLLDRRRIFPNYGFMSLPIFKFARVIPC